MRQINACKHIFHSECLEEFFKLKKTLAGLTCPLCKANIRVVQNTKENKSADTN